MKQLSILLLACALLACHKSSPAPAKSHAGTSVSDSVTLHCTVHIKHYPSLAADTSVNQYMYVYVYTPGEAVYNAGDIGTAGHYDSTSCTARCLRSDSITIPQMLIGSHGQGYVYSYSWRVNDTLAGSCQVMDTGTYTESIISIGHSLKQHQVTMQ